MSLTRPLVAPFDLSLSMFDLFEEPEMALSLDVFNSSGTSSFRCYYRRDFPDRKHTWTTELKGGADWKHQYTTEIKGLEGRKYKWTVEIESPEKEVKTKGKCSTHEVEIEEPDDDAATILNVEIEEPDDHAATILKRAFERRAGAVAKLRGKRPMLSPEEAVVVIEKTLKPYLIHRSKSLQALRELAAAKSKLKELKESFNAYSYRQTVARDSHEHRRFSE
ncbi:hypothetical protein Goshw_022228 [Gossypium schwendimanii]|uniref:Uncharacterized protein n=1 Tax=Gossypium schwendimanii TaxID=34291 RepID=A0A7J9LXT0_GOSSC|nr:hypothetical protein [Gossypium schwendimanii]